MEQEVLGKYDDVHKDLTEKRGRTLIEENGRILRAQEEEIAP